MANKTKVLPMDRFRLAQAKYDKLSKMQDTLSEMQDSLNQDIDFRYDNTDGIPTIEKKDCLDNDTETAEELINKLTRLVESEMNFQQREAAKAAIDLKKDK